MKENKVRIADIAEELGVSTATVSNVIHGKTKKISAKTVEMVQRKLEERQYIPNMAATLLAQNDSRIIGVVVKTTKSTRDMCWKIPSSPPPSMTLPLRSREQGCL